MANTMLGLGGSGSGLRLGVPGRQCPLGGVRRRCGGTICARETRGTRALGRVIGSGSQALQIGLDGREIMPMMMQLGKEKRRLAEKCCATNAESSGKADVARRNLSKVGETMRSLGWIGFWAQLSLTIISAVMTIFSVMFSRPSSLASAFSLYVVLFGIACGFFSTYWCFGYIQLSKTIRRSLKNLASAPKKAGVERNLSVGLMTNMVGLTSTLVGLQAVVGFLVAKTLANATANPFLSGGVGSFNPVLALDVFLVQAASNCLLSHFLSLCITMWIQKILQRA
mmetsp:Transcript_8251/g.21270  ORF Transcript_8251/g.21270 Transcript_8251/m.21270 type:complete len:283 (-) Transcript_8251:240-1088(-)